MITSLMGLVVDDVRKWNPREQASGPFTYVDLSSVDQKTKKIAEPSTIAASDAPSRARQLISTGDVVVSTVRPNLNAVAHVSPDLDGATASTGFCVLRPRPGELDDRYLFHWVRTRQFIDRMVLLATGASYPAVSDKIVKSSEIPLPPFEEQRRVAEILDAADALRAKRREATAKLGELAQSIFIDMFGDPASSQWPAVPFESLLVKPLRNGVSPSSSGGFVGSVLTLSAITGSRFDNSSMKESTFAESHRADKVVSADDFLICRGNGNLSLVGRAKYPTTSLSSVAFPDTMIAASCDFDTVSREYLAHIWEDPWIRRQVEALARTTSGTHKINQSMIRSISVPLPPINLQREFEAAMQRVARHRISVNWSSEQLDTLFASLQQRAFRGDL